MPPKEKYTDPELRDEVKEEIKESDKGGAPGQWSARKAQFMAQEYKKRGGDYNTDKKDKDESQQNLSNWGDEEWQTKEGSGNAKKEDGTQKRYLPKKAWEEMTDEEKEATDRKKQEESAEGKQFVANTDRAKDSRKQASKGQHKKEKNDGEEGQGEDEDGEDEDGEDDDGEDDKAEDDDEDEDDEDEDDQDEDDQDEDDQDEDDQDEDDQENGDDDAKTGDKRKNSKQANGGSNKKQKDNSGNGKSNGTVGSKHMDAEEPGQRGSKDRLPKKGQKAQWKAMPGYVDGEVVEVLTAGKDVDGKNVKASKDDPKVVLKSSSSGKICVHKPDACFYD